MIILKYWPSSLCCTIYPCSLFILYIIVCTSKFHTPILSLPWSLSLLVCSLCVWVCFLFVISTSLFYFLDSTCEWYHTFFVFVWLFSLSIIPSKSIHVVANSNISFFLWLSNIPLCVCVCVYILHLLYTFICWWTLSLLPYLDNGK